MHHIDLIEGLPTIGETYLVRCVNTNCFLTTSNDKDGHWFPIIGKPHDDREYLNVDFRHYHFDMRFLTTAEVDWLLSGYIKKPKISAGLTRVIKIDDILEGPVYREKECKRQMPTFPVDIRVGSMDMDYYGALIGKLEPHYIDQSLKQNKPNCRRCPHRGLPLNGLPMRDDGTVVCAGHGLAWNINTGKMVTRKFEVDPPEAIEAA